MPFLKSLAESFSGRRQQITGDFSGDIKMANEKKSSSKLYRFWKILGPGLVTGPSDDDPSGIATYSLNYIGISPIKALKYSAILYGLTAPVLIAIILHISNDKKIMGKDTNGKTSNILGFATFILMSVTAVLLVYMQLTEK